MTNKSKIIGKNKKHLIDKDAVWGLPLIFFIMFFVFIFLINYNHSSMGPSAAAVAQNTPFFSVYKVLLSAGISLILIGFLLISRSVLPIDTYSKSNSSYLFTNHWHTTFFKVIIIVIGLILSILSYIFEPESKIPYTFWDSVLTVIGIFFIIGIAIQIINSVRSIIQNKGDYILIDDYKIEWFDDKNKAVKEIKISDIKSCKQILEETEKSPEIIGILFNSGKENELKIDFESMSLIPQSEFIYDIISKKNPENTTKE
jgi:hypothetical protein